MVGGERRLAAIMFTDIVGYTRQSQANEALALELLEEHRELLRPVFRAHGGTEVKTIGDAFLVEFRSALEAVLCAVEMQNNLRDRNKAAPASRVLEIRIGIHLGDVVHEGSDVYGDAVNVASRVEPLAAPGGICISQQVLDQIRNKTELNIEKMGETQLKNVGLPLGVYRVSLPESGRPKEEAKAPRQRLAVLPFVNISPDPNDEYFADGLTEELISKLSEIKGLKVIARTSVMSYKRTPKKISEIAKELAAGSIVEGSVRKAGNKIRVAVQLIDAHTEEHLWASNYDKELDDIFAIQSDVASRVAASLSSGSFFGGQHRDTNDIEAYTMYLRAIHGMHETSESSMKDALSLFEHATARDPLFARAFAGIALTWGKLATNGYEDFSVVSEKAEPAARRALELGPDLAEAHVAMATVDLLLDRFDDGVVEAEKAIQINPNLADARVSLGILYSHQRTLDDALREFQRAYELDPLSFHALHFLALAARVAGRFDIAFDILGKMKELSPSNPRVYIGLSECYLLQGDYTRSQEMLDAARQLGPAEPLVWLNQGVLYALTGRRREAEDILNRIASAERESIRLYGVLFIQTALGNLDEAYKALDRQAETHTWPFLLSVHPLFRELRKDPRYREFCKKVGIPY